MTIFHIMSYSVCYIRIDDALHEVKIKWDVRENHEMHRKEFVLSSATMRLKPKKIRFRFDNLFKENKELGT